MVTHKVFANSQSAVSDNISDETYLLHMEICRYRISFSRLTSATLACLMNVGLRATNVLHVRPVHQDSFDPAAVARVQGLANHAQAGSIKQVE